MIENMENMLYQLYPPLRFICQQTSKYLYTELIRCLCCSAATGRTGTDHPDARLNWGYEIKKHRVDGSEIPQSWKIFHVFFVR